MKVQSTVVLLILFLAVFGIFAVVKLTDQPTREERAKRQDRVIQDLYGIEPEDVDQVRLRRDKEELVFEFDQKKQRWNLRQPLEVLADTSSVRSMITALTGLARKSNTEPIIVGARDASRLATYGLQEPAKSIEVHVKASKGKSERRATLDVGKETPDGFGVNVKVSGADTVFVVDKSSLDALHKKIAELRQKQLVTIGRFDARYLHLQWPDRSITAEKKDNKWRLTLPLADRADENQVGQVIGDAAEFKAEQDEDFLDDSVTAEELAKYGLDKPHLIVELRKPPKDDEEKGKKASAGNERTLAEKLLIGAEVEGKAGKRYAKLDDQHYVVAVSTKAMEKLDKRPNDLRSRDLLDLVRADVDFLRIERRIGQEGSKETAATVELGKPEFDWKIYKPVAAAGDAAAVSDFLSKLTEQRIEEFLDDANPAEYGLESPGRVISVWEKGLEEKGSAGEGQGSDAKAVDAKKKGSSKQEKPDASEGTADKEKSPTPKGEPTKILVGKHDAEKKRLYVARGGQKGVLAIKDDLVATLDAGDLAFRDKKIFDFINNGDAAQVDLVREGQTFTLVRRKEGSDEKAPERWRLTKPVDAPAHAQTADDIVGRLFSLLRAEKLVAEKPADLAPYGLAEPPLRVTLTMKAENGKQAKQHTLLIGAKVAKDATAEQKPESTASFSTTAQEQYYAKKADGDLVFTIAADKVKPLQEELREREVFNFQASEVKELALTYPDRKLELAYTAPEGKPDKAWALKGEAPFELDKAKVGTLVDNLSRLQALRFAQYEGEPKAEYGLGSPAVVVEIALSRDQRKTLRIGAAKDDKARYGAADTLVGAVFELDAAKFGELASKADYLAAPPKEPAEKPASEPAKEQSPKDEAKKSETDVPQKKPGGAGPKPAEQKADDKAGEKPRGK